MIVRKGALACWTAVLDFWLLVPAFWMFLSIRSNPGELYYIIFFTPIAGAVWMQIRMIPIIRDLASRGHREELAITMIQSKDYLRSRLRTAFLRHTALIYVTSPIFLIALWNGMIRYPSPDYAGFFFVAILSVSLQVSALSVGITGVLDLLIRLCRATSPGTLPVVLALKWSLILVLTPIGVFYLIIFALLGSHAPDGEPVFFLAPAGTLVFAAFVSWAAFRRWKKACESYYQFE